MMTEQELATLPRPEAIARILTISRRMAETRRLLPLLEYAIDEVISLVDAEMGSIVLKDADDAWRYVVRRDRKGVELAFNEDQLSHAILDKTIENRKSLITRDAMRDARFSTSDSVTDLKLRSLLCVPLTTRNRVIGVVYVENRSQPERFSEADALLLELLSNQAAVAIENAAFNERIQNEYDETRALDALKTSLVLLVARQLRTPLSELKGNAHLVQMKLEALEDVDSTDGISAETSDPLMLRFMQVIDHVDNTIDDIALVLRILSGELADDLIKSKLRIDGLLQELVLGVQPSCEQRALRLDYRSDPGALLNVSADRHYLCIALGNLLRNAVRTTPDGGVIGVSAVGDGVHVTITIQDDGMGMSSAEMAQAFDLKELLKRQPSDRSLVSGLGLPIAHAIIGDCGGSVKIESDLSVGGTRYIVTLPAV